MRLPSYRLRQLALAVATANALRPPRQPHAGVAAFFAGWLTGELAPQLLAASVADTAVQAARKGRRTDAVGLGLAAASSVGLARLISEALKVRTVLEDALREGLGDDYESTRTTENPIPWQAVASPLGAFSDRDPDVRVIRNLAYADHGRRGTLDLYLPTRTATQPAPVLVQVHGGAWILGRKDQQAVPLMRHLAARGWICVAINYRLAPRNPFPAQIIDVKQALAWVRAHIAEYGGDSRYVALTGGSAGGHLAALAALTPGDPAYQPGFEQADTSVECAIPFYGVYDFAGASGLRSAELMRDRFLAPRVLHSTWSEEPARFEAASPLLRITPDAPDFFVIHGASDTMVEVAQGRLFAERLREVSHNTVVYAELPGAQHAFDVFGSIRSEYVIRAVARFLTWHHARWLAAADAVSDAGSVVEVPPVGADVRGAAS